MKRFRYYREKTLPFHAAFLVVFSVLYVDLYIIRADRIEVKFLLIAVLCVIFPVWFIVESILLLSWKNRCLANGTEYEGTVVGKVGLTMYSGGYCYRLVVKYKNGRAVTPAVQAKYVDRLKSRKCKVYEFEDETYVTGFTLCQKHEEPAEIRVMDKSELAGKDRT